MSRDVKGVAFRRGLDPTPHRSNLANMARIGPKSAAEAVQLLSTLQARLRLASTERGHALSILDVGPNQCRFIIDDGTVPALCCAAPAPVGSSWCDTHFHIVYIPEGRAHREFRLRVRTH